VNQNPSLNWSLIVSSLDYEGFLLPDENAFTLFMTMYKLGCEASFLFDLSFQFIEYDTSSFLESSSCWQKLELPKSMKSRTGCKILLSRDFVNRTPFLLTLFVAMCGRTMRVRHAISAAPEVFCFAHSTRKLVWFNHNNILLLIIPSECDSQHPCNYEIVT
jgi:hypothetical protein